MQLKSILYMSCVVLLGIYVSSCTKLCKIDKPDMISGQIVKNTVIWPEIGYATQNELRWLNGYAGDFVIDEDHPLKNRFKVSIDGSLKGPIDYSEYSVLCYGMHVGCNVQFDRNVTFYHATQTVKYSITVTECIDCDELRYAENYVLVPKFPPTYTVIYDIKTIKKS